MAKATSPITEGPVKGAVKGKGTAVKPPPPPAPAKVARTKKVTPALSPLFEEEPKAAKPAAKKPAPKVTKTAAKKVTEPAPAPVERTLVKPRSAKELTPAKSPAKAAVVTEPARLIKLPSKKKTLPTPPVPVPVDSEETSAGEAGLLVADSFAEPKKQQTKEEIAIELLWAKVFNAYLKRDLAQAKTAVDALNKK